MEHPTETSELIELFQQQLADDPATLLKHFSALLNHGDAHRRELTKVFKPCLDGGLPADGASLAQGLAWLAQGDLRDVLSQVDQPTLLLHGAADPLMPLAAARRMKGLLSAGSLSVAEDAAHGFFVSRPEALVAELVEFCGGGA